MSVIWTPEIIDIFRTYAAIYPEHPEVRDMGLLQSSVERPRTTLFGAEQYPSIHDKAASILDSFCRNHSLVDGNKRCAWIAVELIYFRNLGAIWVAGDDAAYELVIRASDSHLDVTDIAHDLRAGFSQTQS
ncbi:type II toxin-antitoxin system death-on-curing family toxin [Dietzia kunjamensis]|uniref:type II toxin-antitoxin system death-on-curing family toxin n=1 Tax=Dietzia kunjamensis TaxID=322509 RepID=UPI0039BC9CBA